MLDVHLLGGLSAVVDGRPVELPSDARARELLARLALAPAPLPRSVLAGRLRPDVPEESARKTLRNAVYELRRALGPAREAVDTAGDGLALSGGVRVDVREFRRRLADGDLEGAAALGDGELLAGLDGEWVLRERDAHAADLARLYAALADRAAEAGDTASAVLWARRGLRVEPLSEAAHRRLVRMLALGGDRPAALAAARDMAERLRAELGIATSPETRALVDEVRRGAISRPASPAPAPGAPPLPAPLAAADRPEGRDEPLRRLDDAWRGALAGAQGVVLVTGEPGIGKTTLAAEFARRVHAAGAAVLLGRCDEQALVPFQPWIEALDGLLDGLPADDAERWLGANDGALARLMPARSAADAAPPGPRERYLAFELVRRLLQDAASRSPVLLVLDDVHWADADSLALVRHLARSAPRSRILVVMCARPAELEHAAGEAIAGLRRALPLTRLDLAGLDDAAVRAVLLRRTGSADAETARSYLTRSGGNPFFLAELLRDSAGAEGHDAPPAGVREVVARRLARLAVDTRRTLDVAAVCGLDFDVATVAEVAGRPVADVLESLDGALDAALVRQTDDRGGHAFAHALVTDTITAALPASRRARLHRDVAGVLAERHARGAAGAGAVLPHVRAAGALADPADLARWERAAADEAAAALAHDEAAAHYAAALAVPDGLGTGERAAVLLALGRAHDRGGRRASARAAFVQAAALGREGRDPGLLARAALGHGGTALVIAAADGAVVDLLEEAIAATPAGDLATASRLRARLAVELYYADPGRARDLGAEAVARARDAGDAATLAYALNARRVVIWSPHHAHERLAVAGEMLAAARASGDRELMLQARNWRVVDLLELGRVREAAAEVDAYAALADEIALPHFGWYVPLWRATLALLAGRWDEGRELTERALALGERADDPNAAMFVGIQRDHTHFAQRRTDLMDRERLVTAAARTPATAEWLVNVALIDAVTGDLDAARPRVAEYARDGCAAFAMDVNWHAVCVLAEAAVEVGDREAAASVYPVLAPHAGLFPLIARAVACLGSAEYHVGRLAGLLGRHDEAVARLRRAVEADEREGAGPHATAALMHLGEALGRAGQPGAAREALRTAAARAEAFSMGPVAARARAGLAATGG